MAHRRIAGAVIFLRVFNRDLNVTLDELRFLRKHSVEGNNHKKSRSRKIEWGGILMYTLIAAIIGLLADIVTIITGFNAIEYSRAGANSGRTVHPFRN